MQWLDTRRHAIVLSVRQRTPQLIAVTGAYLSPGIRGAAPVDDDVVAAVARYQVQLPVSHLVKPRAGEVIVREKRDGVGARDRRDGHTYALRDLDGLPQQIGRHFGQVLDVASRHDQNVVAIDRGSADQRLNAGIAVNNDRRIVKTAERTVSDTMRAPFGALYLQSRPLLIE
jgi:hypothetical protein